jgi:hypothetical protein
MKVILLFAVLISKISFAEPGTCRAICAKVNRNDPSILWWQTDLEDIAVPDIRDEASALATMRKACNAKSGSHIYGKIFTADENGMGYDVHRIKDSEAFSIQLCKSNNSNARVRAADAAKTTVAD